jgi:predicted ribosome quality control (RQC) complex YloA/Tae2 family protein
MATQAGLSGIDVRAVVSELQALLPLWVNKVFQFGGPVMGIRLNGEEHAKHLLIIEPGRRVHLVGEFPQPPKIPPQFAMFLRKYLAGGKVLDIRQHGLSRTIIFDIGKGGTTLHLVIELYDSGNVVLCDSDYVIMRPFSYQRFRERDIVPGALYTLPANDPVLFDEEGFARFLAGENREIVKALAIGALLGGNYAEFICRETGVDKNTPSGSVDATVIRNAIFKLLHRAEAERDPVIAKEGCVPFVTTETGEMKKFPTFNEALDVYYPAKVPKTPGLKKTVVKRSKEEVIREYQEKALVKFNRKVTDLGRAVETIYENYQLVAGIIDTLDQASKTRSWQEIEEIVGKNREGPAGTIGTVYPEDASVELNLGTRVRIYVHENVEANLGRYYAEIKKYKKKIAGAKVAMEKPLPKRVTAKIHAPLLKKKWYHRFRWFFTSDGVLILGGRDASQNDELVKKYMEGKDTFIHADVHGASVVITKGTTDRMDEAAAFAASYSGAWRSGHFSADVYAVRPDQVSKTPESGEYVSRGSFIVRGERNYFRDVPLGIAIGLQIEPEIAVIGGATTAVRHHARYIVELKPGQYEPNDTAKKVLRILREKIPESEWKSLKSVLNTEKVAGFVPPGGSDIIERTETSGEPAGEA